jgi:homoserine dehydrogenase
METYNLAFLGFGNVGRALARLLLEKRSELREQYGMDWRLTGIASRRLGWMADANGCDTERLLQDPTAIRAATSANNVREWLAASRADVMFEISSVNAETGQPALDHLCAALESGAHAITANKGAVVHGYHELLHLARSKGKRFLFEATVLGGTPLFSVFRETLPAAKLLCFRGLVNTTTNIILHEMEQGHGYDDAVRKAQELGVAETDPTNDVDGWDAALKLAILTTVLMDMPLKPRDIERRGIRNLDAARLQQARVDGKRVRLVARMDRTLLGRVVASVGPEELAPDDPLASAGPTSNILYFELDTIHGLTIASHRQGPDTTAYGLFADFINAVQS